GGLLALPEEPFEAARVDGASSGSMFRYLTLPMLAPTIVTAGILRSIDAIKWFDTIYAMMGPGGGSFHEAETINLYAYDLTFGYQRYGEASSVLIMLFLAIVVVVLIFSLIHKRWSVDL